MSSFFRELHTLESAPVLRRYADPLLATTAPSSLCQSMWKSTGSVFRSQQVRVCDQQRDFDLLIDGSSYTSTRRQGNRPDSGSPDECRGGRRFPQICRCSEGRREQIQLSSDTRSNRHVCCKSSSIDVPLCTRITDHVERHEIPEQAGPLRSPMASCLVSPRSPRSCGVGPNHAHCGSTRLGKNSAFWTLTRPPPVVALCRCHSMP